MFSHKTLSIFSQKIPYTSDICFLLVSYEMDSCVVKVLIFLVLGKRRKMENQNESKNLISSKQDVNGQPLNLFGSFIFFSGIGSNIRGFMVLRFQSFIQCIHLILGCGNEGCCFM